MSEQIYARGGQVHIAIYDGHDGDPQSLSPEEARDYAREILEAADECERQLAVIKAERAAIEAACADGHDWGLGGTYYEYGDRDRKVTIQHCRREGCVAYLTLEGWAQFAGREHRDKRGSLISCRGPNCGICDDEKAAAALLAMFRPVLDAALANNTAEDCR